MRNFFINCLCYLCRSSNNLSLNLRSTSPDVDVKQEVLVASTAENDGIAEKPGAKHVSNDKLFKRSSICGNAVVQDSLTPSSVQNDSW